jgi:hypothetical protein
MGKVQKKLGRLHEALASFNQALDLDPKSGNMIKAHIDRLQVHLSMLAHILHTLAHILHTHPASHACVLTQSRHARVHVMEMVLGRGMYIGAGSGQARCETSS